MEPVAELWQFISEKMQWLRDTPEVTWSGAGLTALAVLSFLVSKLFASLFRKESTPPVSNTFTNTGPGEQNVAQGRDAIGKQVNLNAEQVSLPQQASQGDHNVFSQTGNVRYEEHHHHYPRTPQGIPLQRPKQPEHLVGRKDLLRDVLAALEPGKVVTLCGPGGIGKTALASRVAWELSPDGSPPALFPDGLLFYSFYGRKDVNLAFDHLVRSYVDDAQDTGPEAFRLYSGTDADKATVQAICQQLGGWPLALRIAGHYLRSTGESAADYLRWLEQEPLKELGSGQHQDANAALLLRRSMAQVGDDARLALGMAGCLAFASIAREPVAALLEGDEGRARTALNELVDYGLLERQGERWQISHALIHTYARTELALSREILARLAAYYIAWCKEQSAAGVPGYARLDGERVHCLRLIAACLERELWEEVKGLVGAIWEYLDRQGHWTDQLIALEMNLTVARHLDNHKDEGVCLNKLGYTCKRRGEYEKALAWYEQGLTIYHKINNREREAAILNNIAEIYRQQGKYDQALEQCQQSLTIAREIGDRKGEGRVLNNIGNIYLEQGEYQQALAYYVQCLSIRREVGDKRGKGATLNNIAISYAAQDNPNKALEHLEQALLIAQELGNRDGESRTCWNIGRTYENLGELTKTEEYITQAVQIAETIGHPSLEEWRDGLERVRAKRRGA